MPNGKLRGALARMQWRSRHERSAQQQRQIEKREARKEIDTEHSSRVGKE